MKLNWRSSGEKRNMTKKILLIFAVIVYLNSGSTWAQQPDPVSPGAILQRSTDTMEYYLQKKKVEEKAPEPEGKVIDKAKEERPAAAEDDRKVIFVNRIETGKSEILTEAEIDAITRPYEQKNISIRDLFAVVDQINELYKDKKYITAKAILPPQKVEGGIVKIRFIESHVGKVLVEDNETTRESFFSRRIRLHQGDLVRLDTLEDDIVYFNRTNDVKIRAELKAGEAPGTTDTILKAYEPPPFDFFLFADNAGSESVGKNRYGLFITDRSLLGFRDPLTVSTLVASGTFSGFITYNFPVSAAGTRLGATYNYNKTRITAGPLEPMDIGGDAYDFSASLNHPLFVKPTGLFSTYTKYHHKRSRTTFSDITLSDVKVNTYGAGGNYQSFDAYGVWDTTLFFTYGTDNVGDDRNFFLANFNTIRLIRFKEDLTVVLRGGFQVSDSDLLPASEQFQIGGVSTVRGYPEGFLIGDQGYLVTAELNFPLIQHLKGIVFLDHGGAFPYKGNNESIDDKDFLTSAGFGCNIDFPKFLSGKLSFGFPIGGRDEKLDLMRINFLVQASFQ